MTIQQKQVRILGALMSGFSVALIMLFTLGNSQTHRAYAQEATVTAVPTFTPTAVSTPSQTPGPEPNQTITNTQIFVGQGCTDHPYEMGSEVFSHYFYFWGKSGSWYQITTESAAVDTRLLLYRNNPQDNPNEPILAENDDQVQNDQNPKIQYLAPADSFYWLEVQNVEPGRTGTYCLEVKFPGATPTPSPPPDPCEDNYWFNTACEIQLNVTNPISASEHYNFVPASGQGEDNDFYKVWVKQGESYVCRTFELSPQNDTNMILYDQNQNGLGGNDDTQPGDRGSKLNVTVNYTGWLYILVGPNTEIAPGNGDNYTYKLECFYEDLVPTPGGSPEGDKCENNDSFDLASACLLQTEEAFKHEDMNFAAWGGGNRDQDYYKLWAIEGSRYSCETKNLSANNDTYMKIFYPENPHTPIGENDDKPENNGNLGSLVTVDVSRTGWLLILVEPKMPELYGGGADYTYDLECKRNAIPTSGTSSGVNNAPAGSAAALPASTAGGETDVSEEENSDGANEPEAVVVSIKEIQPLTPTPTPTPVLINAAFTLTIYYDQNNNHIVEDGEGVANLPVLIYTGSGNSPFTEVTSGAGKLAIAFSTSSNSVRLVVPYLGIDQQIPILNTQEVQLRIASQ
jgi:hypothetical protein